MEMMDDALYGKILGLNFGRVFADTELSTDRGKGGMNFLTVAEPRNPMKPKGTK